MTKRRIATILWLYFLLAARNVDSAVYISDLSMSRMIELMAKRPFCKLHTDRGDIQRLLLAADQKRVRHVPLENVLALEKVCQEAGGLQGELQGGLGFIYPGTKWCGPGSIASEYNDVGRYADEDRCCREHDLCPHTLSPGECKRGLCNQQQFTRSHCDCDARFRRCLQGLNTETANTLGAVFFNVVQVTCFKERRPCSIYQSFKPFCPLEYFQTEPFLTTPLLSAIRYSEDSFARSSNKRSYELNSGPTNGNRFDTARNYETYDFTIEQPNGTADIDRRVRLASIGLVAKNIFKDVVVRPIRGFAKFVQTAKGVWDSQMQIGYNKTVTDEMCSQWKYRPSEKYIASIQYKSYK